MYSNALVAQSEERATVNRKVGGSKPPEGVQHKYQSGQMGGA